MNKFIHLHLHSEYSVLDGLGTTDEYVAKALELGQPALALTDHGNMCGAPEFYHKCRKAGIEPVLGEEFYFVPDADHRPAKGEDYERYHVVILAKGERGYQILSELSTEAYRHFYYKPLIGREQLEDLGDDAQHLVVLSGCAASIISKAVRAGDMRAARQELVWWKEVFPHFYIELQHHDTEFDKQLNEGLLALARRYQLPWVVTNDPHYAVEEDCDYHDALLAIQTAADIDDPNRFRFDGSGYHLRSRPEMAKAFRSYGNEVWKPGAAETLRIARACRTRIRAWESRTWHIPKYPDADGGSYRFLERLAVRRLKKLGLWDSAEYRDRMDHELSVIKQTGIADFLLITRDCIEWAKQQGIPVGPGRGSVCGTLVGYLIGLHKIDPVRYNLMFERFLNPARPRMPDIDTDFGQRRRDELFDYVKAKYGQDNVVHVCAYARMNNKAAFQSLARAHGISYPDRIRISKLMTEADEEEDLLPEEVRQAYPELAGQLMRLSGVKRAIQTHPAGVIIADDDFRIRELVPEMWIPNTKRWVGMYDLDAVEEMGLMKQDFLVLRTLDTIDDCLQLVFKRTGERLDPDSWVPDEEEHDDAVYKMLAEGRTAGVFQMEGPTNQRGCLDVKPECFEDIVSITSLYRTGAISAGFPKIFIKNRQAGKRRIEYAHPLLKPILRDTWGVVLYQEQVMEIGRSLAGFTMEQVDDIKEAIKHKKSTLMQSMKPVFIAGAAHHHNIDRETSTKIWKMIEGYSGYGYNRCLSEDTVVYRAGNSGEGVEITLGELYRRWNTPGAARKKYRSQGIKVLAYKDGVIKPGTAVAIHNSGVQPVYRVTLANGMTIDATANHRHLTVDGWKQVSELGPQDLLLVNLERQASYRPNGAGKGWAASAERTVAADGRLRPSRGGHVAGLAAVTALLPDVCERCGAGEGRLERAHLDHDRSNNSRENVVRLCNSCHKEHDRERRSMDSGGPRFRRGFAVGSSRVVAIEPIGYKQTYDLEMEDEGHNFVANGVVTHNSHAVAYSFITYQTARLKALYSLEFYTALLRTVEVDHKRDAYMREAVEAGIRILAPDVNASGERTTVDGDAIRFGLADIAGIGPKQAAKLVEGRSEAPYASVAGVEAAARNKGVLRALEDAGALASLGVAENPDRQEDLLGWCFHDRMEPYRRKHRHDVEFPDEDGGFVHLIGEIFKIERGRTKNGKPYMTWKLRWSPSQQWDVRLWAETEKHWDLKKGSIVSVRGEWESRWLNVSVGNPRMVRVIKRAN